MLDVLARLLIVGVILLVPTTVLVFTVRSCVPARLSPVAASLGAVAVAVAALGIGGALGLSVWQSTVSAVLLGATVLGWLPAARDWDVRGLVAWAVAIDVGVVYLLYVAVWTVTQHPGPWATALSAVLWVLELFVFVIGSGYLWEMVDVLARRVWTSAPAPLPADARQEPFVSLHVPTHNEPPEMVIETLRRMLALDYDNYEILLVDNNTDDPALWQPLEEFCRTQDRISFIHLENWPGYKSGALNVALRRVDPRTEIIGIVDADYHVEPDFLADCAPLFADPEVAFVQTPQDYRDHEVSSYFRRLYYSYAYFFDVSQKSRHERNGAIFGGTMGLIRASALRDAGGWDEWCITEDAELSLRLLRAGGTGLHIDRAYGRGVMPLTFESLKGQRFRWCFGGIQILRLHARSLLPGRRTPENQLTMGQRWAYLVGGLQWFGDLAGLLFLGFLLLGAVDLAVGSDLVVRRMSGLLLLAAVGLVMLGGVRSVALIRRSSGARWRDAFGAFGLWLALGLTVARASWLGLVSREGTFLRTPKVKGEPRLTDALRGNCPESLLATVAIGMAVVVGVRGGATGIAVGLLLAVQGLGFALAPINSWAAIRSDLPSDLRRRRRDRRSWATVGTPVVRRGGLVLVATGALLVVLVAVAAPVGSPSSPGVAGAVAQALDGRPAHRDVGPREHPSPSPHPSTRVRSAVTRAATAPVGERTTLAPATRSPAAGAPTRRAPIGTPTSRPTAAPTSRPTSTPTTGLRSTSVPTTTGGKPTSRPTQAGGKPTSKPTQAGGKPTGKPSHP